MSFAAFYSEPGESLLARVRDAGLDWVDDPVVLYADGTQLHGDQFCTPTGLARVVIEPDEAVRSTPPRCSECIGWRSSSFGIRLQWAAQRLSVIDAYNTGLVPATWQQMVNDLENHAGVLRGVDHDNLAPDAQDAVLGMLARARDQLGTTALTNAIASAGMQISLRASQAATFTAWAAGERLRADANRKRPNPLFEQARSAAVTAPADTILAITGCDDISPARWGLAEEVALLTWCAGTPVPGRAGIYWLRVPEAVADGAIELERPGRIARSTHPETDDQLVTDAVSLWSDNPHDGLSLDQCLTVARHA